MLARMAGNETGIGNHDKVDLAALKLFTDPVAEGENFQEIARGRLIDPLHHGMHQYDAGVIRKPPAESALLGDHRI